MVGRFLRWCGFTLALGAAAASCAGDESKSAGPVLLRAGERTPLEVTLPADTASQIRAKSVLLELKQVVLPLQVSGMRVFLVVKSPDGSWKTEYVSSVSRGQVAEGNPAESFVIELNRTLKQASNLAAIGAGPHTLRFLLEPILRPAQTPTDPVRVGDVTVRLE